MTDHWKDVRRVGLNGSVFTWKDRALYYADEVDAARAKDAEKIAWLHDIIAAYEAVTDPEQHPDLFARSSAVLEDCRNPSCADQTVAQDLRDQVAAKDAEIARLRAQVEQDAHLRSVVELYRSDPMAMADAIVRLREDVGVLRSVVEEPHDVPTEERDRAYVPPVDE